MSHIESKGLEMYHITPSPPKMDLQEYIKQYVRTVTTSISIGFCTITSRR